MNKKLAITLTLIVLLVVVIVAKGDFLKSEDQGIIESDQTSGLAYYPPGLGMYENYTKDAKIYQSRLGFSFKYPPYLHIIDMTDEYSPERVIAIPIDSNDPHGVVVSVGLNDEEMTAEEWLLSENSGYLQSKDEYGDYQKFTLDRQESVVTDSGGWVVVNTPDNKYRLSIALLPGKDGNLLFTEMGIIIDSLRF